MQEKPTHLRTHTTYKKDNSLKIKRYLQNLKHAQVRLLYLPVIGELV